MIAMQSAELLHRPRPPAGRAELCRESARPLLRPPVVSDGYPTALTAFASPSAATPPAAPGSSGAGSVSRRSSGGGASEQWPPSFCCPITHEPMHDPVVAFDGAPWTSATKPFFTSCASRYRTSLRNGRTGKCGMTPLPSSRPLLRVHGHPRVAARAPVSDDDAFSTTIQSP
jgi:hypothetical protein